MQRTEHANPVVKYIKIDYQPLCLPLVEGTDLIGDRRARVNAQVTGWPLWPLNLWTLTSSRVGRIFQYTETEVQVRGYTCVEGFSRTIKSRVEVGKRLKTEAHERMEKKRDVVSDWNKVSIKSWKFNQWSKIFFISFDCIM